MRENFLLAQYIDVQTFKYIIGAILFILLTVYFSMAFHHILTAGTKTRPTEKYSNKQEYVKQNLHIFGIRDREGSEIKEVFVVPYNKMGFGTAKDEIETN